MMNLLMKVCCNWFIFLTFSTCLKTSKTSLQLIVMMPIGYFLQRMQQFRDILSHFAISRWRCKVYFCIDFVFCCPEPFTNQQHLTNGRKREIDHLVDLHKEIWYHGEITRAEAEKLLKKDGDFLVRKSPNSEGQFVLSGMQDNTKKHLLLVDPEGIVCILFHCLFIETQTVSLHVDFLFKMKQMCCFAATSKDIWKESVNVACHPVWLAPLHWKIIQKPNHTIEIHLVCGVYQVILCFWSIFLTL